MNGTFRVALWVAAGSALGGILRLAVSHLHLAHGDVTAFPWATLTVNVAGSLLVGYLARHTNSDGLLPCAEPVRQFLLAGICGGFTTFSLFSLETLMLLDAGNRVMAAGNILATLAGGVAAAAVGWSLASRMAARRDVSG